MKTVKHYNKREKIEAKKDGAKLVRNSGRGKEKGDAKIWNFLVDYKFNAKSFQLKLENWKKHSKDALNENYRDPMIVIVFEDSTKLAIIDYKLLEEYMELKNDSE